MRFAYPMQKFQDWVTQQWVILRGRKIKPEDFPWLIGPFGNLDAIGEDFISICGKGELKYRKRFEGKRHYSFNAKTEFIRI